MMAGIEQVYIVGAGTMGPGIAQAAAQSGMKVMLYDSAPGAVEAALRRIASYLSRAVEKGKLSIEDSRLILDRIRESKDLQDAAGSQLVIEAVPEEIDIKKKIFARLDHICGSGTILATNTSSLSITEIARSVEKDERVVGIHFFNPAPVMQLVEIVRGSSTSDQTVEAARCFALALGKTPVIVNESPGFIVNRLLLPMINEAAFCLMEGVATAEDIDTAMKLGANHPLGPLALADLIGLDVCLAIMESLNREFGDDKYRPCPLIRKLVRAGKLGRKTGSGFYEYD